MLPFFKLGQEVHLVKLYLTMSKIFCIPILFVWL